MGVTTTADGSVYITDWLGKDKVRRVDRFGNITVVAGGGDDPNDGVLATKAQLTLPQNIAFTPDGGFVIGQQQDYRLRYVGPDQIINTIAGTGERGFSGDGGPARAAHIGGVFDV